VAVMDLGFEVELTGLDLPEIDLILSEAAEASADPIGPEDEHPRPASQAITRQGDLWILGRHFLFCGDAKNPALIARLMAGSKAHMYFGDPPYNLKIRGHVSGLGATQHREFAETSCALSFSTAEARGHSYGRPYYGGGHQYIICRCHEP
jgi:hypothetical protein